MPIKILKSKQPIVSIHMETTRIDHHIKISSSRYILQMNIKQLTIDIEKRIKEDNSLFI